MSLPDSYTLKPGSIPAYFEAMLSAEAPKRFTARFLESLEFTSSTDRLFIGILRDLGFIDQESAPTKRYYEFLDRSQSARVIAQGVREAFSDLFAINKEANTLTTEDVKNKLRTLYQGAKTDGLISRIASTFTALSEYGDFTGNPPRAAEVSPPDASKANTTATMETGDKNLPLPGAPQKSIGLDSLQYHINIVLPESRDQAVYDAIFKSLRDHLGTRNG
jgi:hypothetical protein